MEGNLASTATESTATGRIRPAQVFGWSRRQMWASDRILSSRIARDHPFAPARPSARLETRPTIVTRFEEKPADSISFIIQVSVLILTFISTTIVALVADVRYIYACIRAILIPAKRSRTVLRARRGQSRKRAANSPDLTRFRARGNPRLARRR